MNFTAKELGFIGTADQLETIDLAIERGFLAYDYLDQPENPNNDGQSWESCFEAVSSYAHGMADEIEVEYTKPGNYEELKEGWNNA